jgi:hypothetical protein
VEEWRGGGVAEHPRAAGAAATGASSSVMPGQRKCLRNWCARIDHFRVSIMRLPRDQFLTNDGENRCRAATAAEHPAFWREFPDMAFWCSHGCQFRDCCSAPTGFSVYRPSGNRIRGLGSMAPGTIPSKIERNSKMGSRAAIPVFGKRLASPGPADRRDNFVLPARALSVSLTRSEGSLSGSIIRIGRVGLGVRPYPNRGYDGVGRTPKPPLSRWHGALQAVRRNRYGGSTDSVRLVDQGEVAVTPIGPGELFWNAGGRASDSLRRGCRVRIGLSGALSRS